MKNKIDLQAKIDIKNHETNPASPSRRRGRGQTYINNSKDFSLRAENARPDLKEEEMNKSILGRLNPVISANIVDQEEAMMARTAAKRNTRTEKRTSKARKTSLVPTSNDPNGLMDDRNKFLNQLNRHAEAINSRMGDLLRRSERLNDNAKRLSNQIDSMLKE